MRRISGFFIAFLFMIPIGCKEKVNLDRYAIVTRHNIENSLIDSLNSLSVGNGEFAFTVDITGLQTFPDFHEKGVSLGTMSNWGWHTGENPENFQLSDVYKTYQVHGREIDYVRQFRPDEDIRKAEASEWLRTNPHRIHLGMIGLEILKSDGTEITIDDVAEPVQRLDLWRGIIDSRFNVEGVPVHVLTLCHPDKDMIAVRISSPLIRDRRLRIKIAFPLGIPLPAGYDFSQPGRHSTRVISRSGDVTGFEREKDNDKYYMRAVHRKAGLTEEGEHLFYIGPETSGQTFECSFQFSKDPISEMTSDFKTAGKKSDAAWQLFWTTGGAVDFSGCTDPRAFELERRIILSQYLTRIQCSGSLPPAETGLTFNSWYGKFHLEMHWWHAVHFALWQRGKILEKQMEYYTAIFETARKTSEHQGYNGVRWPKMVGPDGRESPSTVGTYLIWQQPHVIFYPELLYKNSEDKKAILDKYSKLVFATADFMASYVWFDTVSGRYILGPVLIPAQESLRLETTINPVFELAYWYWGLKTARDWKIRLGLEPDPLWTDIIEKISELPVLDDVYLCSEDTRDSWENPRYMSDHPIVSGISGVIPRTRLVDTEILSNTLDTIKRKWNWQSTWGWDFPMLAMSAASIGRGEDAIDFLLMDAPKNRYLLNGHNYQDARLSIYLPGNGGILTAVAKMCVSDQFPRNGKWNVRWENLNSYVE
ncbi:MAG: hypothetical protein R6W81_03910 [Bacteroidales bacterium]